MFKTVNVSSFETIPCSADVLKWNYWDLEHFIPVHGGYSNGITICQSKYYVFSIFWTKVPFIQLSLPTVMFMVENGRYGQYTFALQGFLLSKTSIDISPISSESCSVTVTYQFLLPKQLSFFSGLLKKFSKKWFNTVLSEDMPLRVRRQKVLNSGFVDYKGFDHSNNSSSPYKCSLPIIPAPGSDLIKHDLYTYVSH